MDALTEELSLLPGPARTHTVEVLSRVWRLLPTLHLSNRRNQMGTLHETENVRTGSDRERGG